MPHLCHLSLGGFPAGAELVFEVKDNHLKQKLVQKFNELKDWQEIVVDRYICTGGLCVNVFVGRFILSFYSFH